MPQPIPHDSIRPLVAGERVRILPQWQDPGDDEYERTVIEAPADSPRVLIRTTIPGMAISPTETIDASRLERVIDLGKLADLDAPTAIKEHAGELTREQRLFFVEKFPFVTLQALGGRVTAEEVGLCVQLHPSIALNLAAAHLTADQLELLAESHSFDALLHASHRLDPETLRRLTTVHPGECIVILERHPESRLRQSLRALHGDLNPNVARTLATILSPGG
jgi:hypothetical protein